MFRGAELFPLSADLSWLVKLPCSVSRNFKGVRSSVIVSDLVDAQNGSFPHLSETRSTISTEISKDFYSFLTKRAFCSLWKELVIHEAERSADCWLINIRLQLASRSQRPINTHGVFRYISASNIGSELKHLEKNPSPSYSCECMKTIFPLWFI